MKIAITGSTGLVGNAIVEYFQSLNYTVVRIVREETKQTSNDRLIVWDVNAHHFQTEQLEGMDAVIHLAGANIANKRWTPKYKELIQRSRVHSTHLLAKAILNLKKPPSVFLCASAIGYYGVSLEDNPVNESASPADDFLAHVCVEWERATEPVALAGIRTINMRLGAVLSKKGGAIGKMLLPFKLGLGGKLGSGKQMFSWVLLDEIPRIADYLIKNNNISGPVNVVAPDALTNKEFTKAMGKALKRPTLLPLPGFMAKMMFGEMADALLLKGAHVIPKKLIDYKYKFQYPTIEKALAKCFEKKRK